MGPSEKEELEWSHKEKMLLGSLDVAEPEVVMKAAMW